MRIYVAAKFEDKATVRDAFQKLRAAGHEITHDWTVEDESKAAPGKLDEYRAHCAEKDIEGVMEADALVLFPHAQGKGLYVELGAALAAAIPVVCVSKGVDLPNCVFLWLEDVHHVETIEQAVSAIGRGVRPTWARRNAS